MSRGKKTNLNQKRQAMRSLDDLTFPQDNDRVRIYEPTGGHQIKVQVNKKTVVLGLNIHDREIGETEFNQYLPVFLRYIDRLCKHPDAFSCGIFLENEDGTGLAITEAGGGIRIQVENNAQAVASTLIPLGTWREILKEIQEKMQHIER